MSTIKSAAAWFRAADHKKVRKTVHNLMTVEQWEAELETIIADIIRSNTLAGNTLTRDMITEDSDGNLHFEGSNQVLFKPKLHAEEVGVMEVRSKDYIFRRMGREEIFGDKKGCTVDADGNLIKALPHANGAYIRYSILSILE